MPAWGAIRKPNSTNQPLPPSIGPQRRILLIDIQVDHLESSFLEALIQQVEGLVSLPDGGMRNGQIARRQVAFLLASEVFQSKQHGVCELTFIHLCVHISQIGKSTSAEIIR